MSEEKPSWPARPALWLVGAYQRWLSRPLHALVPGAGCRFQPTCSGYALTSLRRFGLLRGGWLAARRICRCHPWGGSGVDEVPEK
jgi:putative membrane protein insertion efficiency factor